MSVKTQHQNGKGTVTPETLQEATNLKIVESLGQNGQSEENVQNVALPQLTVEDKIQKVALLNELIEKREVIKSHLHRVEAMKFGDFDEKDIINIVSNDGQSYAIKSSVLCEKIADLLKAEMTQKIIDIEGQIQF